MEIGRITHLEIGGQDVTSHIHTEPDDATVCHAYIPPTGKPEDSGYCARCGMFDWQHTGPAPDDIAAWLKDPANHQAVAVVLRTEARRDRHWWDQELRRMARVYGHGRLDRVGGT